MKSLVGRRPTPAASHACTYLALTVAAAATLAGVTACGSPASSPHTAAVPPTTASTTSPAATATAGTGAKPSSPGGTPDSPPPATCAARNLRISNSSYHVGAGGYSAGVLILVNQGPRTCILDGFPGVELIDAHGKVLANAARKCSYLQCSTTPARVTLAPGNTAHVEYVWQDSATEPSQRTCPQSATALVTPPNAYDHQAIPLHIGLCGIPPVFGVGTVQAGPAPAS